MHKKFYSNGKLLLTGEYLILDGAKGLAVPTMFGQHLKVTEISEAKLVWKSLDEKNNVWFESSVELEFLQSKNNTSNSSNTILNTLLKILQEAKKMNPVFLSDSNGYAVETTLTFPRNWGLGSSSTLINNIAQWAKVDAYQLLWNSMSGSGYDIACAQHNNPITYHLEHHAPVVASINFDPPFKNNLYFIYRNQKQDSRAGIANYRKRDFNLETAKTKISTLTSQIITCKTLKEFEQLLDVHETIVSDIIQIPTLKEALFPDYNGGVKSLGAWGGDFMLVTGSPEDMYYFKEKGYPTIVPYTHMVL